MPKVKARLLAAAAAFLISSPAFADNITVFAAASLKNALDEIGKAYELRTRDRVVISYAASSALAKQIEQGAPSDVFISADTDWMDYLEKRNLIRSPTRVSLLRNRLVLVAPSDSSLRLTIGPGFPLASALGKERLSMANPDSVPAGKYGKAALEALGVWKGVERQVASANDVRGALLLVARGETPLGIVYDTDARVEPKVRVIATFPENTHPPIVYPAALTSGSKSGSADTFLRSLREPPARAVFEKYGFR